MFYDNITRRSLSVMGLGLLGGMLLWWLWRRQAGQSARLMVPPEARRPVRRFDVATPDPASVVAGLSFPELAWLAPYSLAAMPAAPAPAAESDALEHLAGITGTSDEPTRQANDETAEPVAAVEAEVEAETPDDLAVIEGIGPAITRVMYDAGITTFEQLAGTDVDRLREILLDAGLRLADPTTWPEQARLAAAGNHDELASWQDQLKAGRRS